MRTPALVAAALLAAMLPASPALAEDKSPFHAQLATVPSTGVMAIEGHGWGHGHGVSQWGSQGGAEVGQTSDAMLAAYYPGTAATVMPARTIRVWISTDDGRSSTVWAADGLAVTDLAGARVDAAGPAPTVLPTGAAFAKWRVVPLSGHLTVQSSADGVAWTTYAPMASVAGPVRFSDTANVIRLAMPGGISKDYRGSINTVLAGTGVQTVDTVDLEDYTRGVVPRESPSSWLPAALQVQAVAARSYASYEADHASAAQPYDICDTDACQVYGGARTYSSAGTPTSLETANTDAAVAATAHVVRTYQGKAAFTQFSSTNGGWTSAGTVPYLDAHPDPWDGVDPHNTGHAWSATLTAAEVEARYPTVGDLTSIEVTKRDGNGEWGGRISKVLLHGVAAGGAPTSVQATGYGVYQAHTWPAASDGLRSEWWQVVGAADVSTPTAQPPGLTPLPPVSVLETGRFPVKAGHPRRVPAIGFPAGASAILVTVTAKAGTQTRGSVLVGPSGGRQVPVAGLTPGATSSGQALIPVPADKKLLVGVSRGSAGISVKVVGAVVPGGAVLAQPVHFTALPVRDGTVTLPAAASTALLAVQGRPGTAITVGTVKVVGSGTVLVTPDTSGQVPVVSTAAVTVQLLAAPGALTGAAKGVRPLSPRITSATVTGHPSYVAMPSVAKGSTVLVHVTATAATRVWPGGTKGPTYLIPAGGQALLVLTLRDGRLLAQTTGATGAVSATALATLSR